MHLQTLLTTIPLLFLLTSLASANVEKTIFLAPPSTTIPTLPPSIDDLGLERLSPDANYLRTRLNATFPSTDGSNKEDEAEGTDSWYYLENLNPGQRYEVRICWLATQPTTFTLTTHPLQTLLSSPPLLTSISIYSSARLSSSPPPTPHKDKRASETQSDSVLFLRVTSSADYFSLDPQLMREVPPVVADIILDPFLFNVFPRSLVSTAVWVLVVAGLAGAVGWWVVGEMRRGMQGVMGSEGRGKVKVR